MSSVTPNVRDVTDFQFKKLRALRVFDQLGELKEKSPNLLAVSNIYGLIFVGSSKSIKVIRTNDIEQLDEDKSLVRVYATEYPFQEVELPADITDLGLSCDSLTLAACMLFDQLPHVHLYDVRSFAEKSTKIVPFSSFELASVSGSSLLDFLWNPAIADMFATCLSDGSVFVYDVSEGTQKIYGRLPPETIATAICWSPKGKQLVVGRRDGTLTQHTPDLNVAKTVPAPYIYETEVTVVNIAWLSSYQFAVVYRVEDRPCLVLVNSPKSGKHIFTDFDDVCFGSSEQHPLRYYMLHVPEMHLLICSSSNALDVAVLSNKEGDGSVWEQWNLEDSGRADLPLLGNDETYPLGMALNVTAQRQILINDTDFVPSKPLLHMLSTGGILLSYRIFGAEPLVQSLMKPPEALLASGIRRPPAVSTFGMVSNATIAKENLLPKFNEASQHSPADSITKPTSGTSFMNLATTADTSFAAPVTTTGTSFIRPTKGMPVVATVATSGASFILPIATAHSSFMASTTTTNTSSAFGHFGSIGKPVSSGSITTGTPLPGTGLDKTTQMQPLASAQPLHSGITNATFVPASTFGRSNMTATNRTGIKIGFTTNLTGKRSQVDSNTKSFPATVPPKAKSNKEPVLKPKPAKRGQRQTALVSAVMEELSKFDAEVKQAKKRTLVMVENIATKEEDNIRTAIGQVNNFLQEVKATARSMNVEIHFLRGSILDGFTAVEEGLSLESRSRDKRFVHLLKTRSLDPLSSKRMKDIRLRFFYLETQLQEANTALDKLWDEFQCEEKKSLAGGADLPSLELVYRAMTINHDIAFNLRHTIDRLAADVVRIKSSSHQPFRMLISSSEKGTNLASPPTQKRLSSLLRSTDDKKDTGILSNDLLSLSDMMLDVSVDSRPLTYLQSPFSTPKTMSKVRQAQLRNFLERRPVTHVRPATPVEEYSQLISPNFTVREFLQGRESEEREVLSVLPPSLNVAAKDVFHERKGSHDSTRPVMDMTFVAVTPPTFRPFFCTQPGGAFMPSQSAVCIQPMIATTGSIPKATSTSLLGVSSPGTTATSTFSTAFGSSATNIFTLAASAPKSFKGGEQAIGLKIGNIPLETIVLEAPAELRVSKSTPNQPKSPILTSLLDAKSQSATTYAAAATNSSAITGFPLGFTGTKLSDSSRMAISAVAAGNKVVTSSTMPFSLTKLGISTASFGTAATMKPAFGSLPPFEFPQNKSMLTGPTGFKEIVNKPKLSAAYEDVTPPTSPLTYLVEEPSNGEEEEYEREEEEQEDEEGERGEGDYEDQEAWEDEVTETADATENVPVENADLCEAVAVEEAGSVVLITNKVVKEKGKADADNGASNNTPSLPKNVVDMTTLIPIFKATSSTPAAASTPTVPEVALSSAFTAPTDTVVEPAAPVAKLTSSAASTSETAAIIFKPATITETAHIFTNSEGPDAKSTVAAAPAQSVAPSVATTSFRFALPAGTTTTAVSTAEKSLPSAFSFTLPPVSTPMSTFAVSTSPQSLFGSKLSFGPSEGSTGAAAHEQSVTTPSIFGGGKSASPFGPQPSAPGVFSFSQPGSSAFGITTTTTSSAFGQAQTAVFGHPPSNASTTFGQQSSESSATTSSSTGGVSLFGQGSGSLFGGLGGKPNPENASKNIFGSPSTFGGAAQTSGLFGSSTSQTSGTSWDKPASGGATSGGFTGSGFSASSGSVSQSGFGFQQSTMKPGTFGGSSGFGSPPTFGGAPTFGSVNQMGNRLFGSSVVQPTGFGSFSSAASDAPTFGSLASQPSALTFNSIAAQQPVSPFCAPTQNPPAFGAAPSFASQAFGTPTQMNASPFGAVTSPAQPTTFGAPAFGSSPSSFGSQPQQPTQGSTSFSQWR